MTSMGERYGASRRPPWRAIVGWLLVLGGAGLFVGLELAREDHTGFTLAGIGCGLIVALGVVTLQRRNS